MFVTVSKWMPKGSCIQRGGAGSGRGPGAEYMSNTGVAGSGGGDSGPFSVDERVSEKWVLGE